MSDSETYYVKRQGRVEGPWTMRKLRSEVGLRKLGRFHEVSEDGENWRRAEEIEGLFTKVPRKIPGGGTGEEWAERTEHATEKAKSTEGAVWYCYIDEEQVGPMTLVELGDMFSEGQLLLDDLIWREDYPDWTPAEEVSELRAFLGALPAGEPDDETGQTRLVQRPDTLPTARLAVASALTAAILCTPSLVPGVGLLGVVPATMAIMAIVSLRQTRAVGLRYAVAGLVVGAIEILWGFVSVVLAILGVTMYWSKF